MNIIYLFYFILKTDYSYLQREIKKTKDKNKFNLILDMISSTLKYGSSFEDYFLYSFSEITDEKKKAYVTTGFARKFFKQLNDSQHIKPFRDKEVFDEKYKEFIKRETILINETSEEVFTKWCNDKKEVMAKPLDGVQGKGIFKSGVVLKGESKNLFQRIKNKNYIVEEVIQQHPILKELNDSCVNSLRVITVNINNEPKVIAAILRIGVGAVVDNFSEGGIAAPIDLKTGIVFKGGIMKDSHEKLEQHPITNINIKGFKIPYWNSVKDMVIKASRVTPLVKTIGWDVAINKHGPDLIEGNDNWNKNIFQLPFDKGKKEELKKIMKKDRMF